MGARPSVRTIGEGLAALDLRGSHQGACARVQIGARQVSYFLMFEFQLRVTRQNLRALRALPTLQKPTISCSPRAIRRSNVASAQTRT
eukprot:COSAG03_NODE_18_length_21685_cov_15.938988_24_plen_88_part_00